MKRFKVLLLLMMIAAVAFSQNRRITGTIVDKDSKEAVMQVTVQLLKKDSTFVGGAVSDYDGNFTVEAPKNGKYLLKSECERVISALDGAITKPKYQTQ